MKKQFKKRGISLILVIVMMMGLIPTVAIPALAMGKTEVDDFDLYMYRANVLAKSEDEGGATFLKDYLDNFLSSDYQSSSRIWVELLEGDSLFMGGLNAWKLYTFDPSNIVSDMLDEKGYYETALFAILKATLEDDKFIDTLLSSTNKQVLSFSKAMMETLDLTDLAQCDLSHPQIADVAKQVVETTWHSAAGDVLGVANEILSCSKDVVDYFNRMASYMTLLRLSDDIKACIDDLYERCPSDTPMKIALFEMQAACQNEFGAAGVALTETGFTLGKIAFNALVDDLFKMLVGSTNPYIAALLIGQTAGKAISNIFFSTDKINEQYYVMRAVVEIENLMRKSVVGLKSNYNRENTTFSAQTYLSSIDLLFLTYLEGNSIANEFVGVAFGNGFASLLGGGQVIDDFKEAYESRRVTYLRAHELISGFWIIKLQNDYPDIYEVLFPSAEQSPVIPIESISFNTPSANLNVGEFSYIGGFDITPSNATLRGSINFKSSDSDIVTVDGGGFINGISDGTATITIYYSSDPSVCDTLSVTVTRPPSFDGISWPFTYTVTDFKATITKCDTSANGSIIIPNTINGYPVVALAARSFENCDNITQLTIGRNIVSIEGSTLGGWLAFKGCSGIETVYYNAVNCDDFSSNNQIFNDCTSLKTIHIGSGVEKIPDYFAYGINSVETITISDSVLSIGRDAFSRSGVSSITIPNSVNILGVFAFAYCQNLTSINLSNNITIIEQRTFQGCEKLQSILIPSKVTTIGAQAFEDCISLTNLTIPNGLISIGRQAFKGCTKLSNVNIPNSVNSVGSDVFEDCSVVNLSINMTTIPSAFANMEALKNLTIGNNVTTIDSYAFDGCTALNSVTIPNSVTAINSYAFRNCTALADLTIPNSVVSLGWKAFESCPIENLSINMTTIPGSINGMSYNKKTLENLTIGNEVETIESYAFYGCTALTNLVVPDSVTSIGSYAFYDCTGIADLEIGNKVETIGARAFQYCEGLTSVKLPDSIEHIGGGAFYVCENIEEFWFPNKSITTGSEVSLVWGAAFPFNEDMTIYGYVNTTPQYFAHHMNYKFVTLNSSIQQIGIKSITYFDVDDSSVFVPFRPTTTGEYTFYFRGGQTGAYADIWQPDSRWKLEFNRFGIIGGSFDVELIGEQQYYFYLQNAYSGNSNSFPVYIELKQEHTPIILIPNRTITVPFLAGDKFSFTPVESGLYTFSSSDDRFYLYDSAERCLAAYESTITYYLDAGEQYIYQSNNYQGGFLTASFTYSSSTYYLTASAGAGGMVSGTTSGSYTEGTAVSVTANPSNGYHFVNWTVSGATITGGNNNNPASFDMPAGAVTLTANFAQDAPTVTGVTVSPATIEVRQGGTQQFSATVDGTSNPAQTVTWSVIGGTGTTNINTTTGVLTVDASQSSGSPLTVTATSTADDTKSGTAAVTVTTTPPAPVYGITLDKIGTHIFAAEQEGYGTQAALTVTIMNTGNQATGILNIGLTGDTSAFNVSPVTIANIEAGSRATFTVTPADGLAMNTYMATITVSGNSDISEIFDVSFTISPAITSTHALTVSAGIGGTVYGTTTGSYVAGEAISVSATASSGYHFVDWTVSGATITGGNTNNPATFLMPTNTVTLTANFEADVAANYAVTVNSSSAATSGSGSYAAGATVIINAGNRSNYSFNGWSATGTTLANPGSEITTFTMPANSVSITANWTYIGGGTYYPPDNSGTTPTNPPTTPSTTEPTQPPTTVSTDGDTTTIGDNNVTTPKGQKPVTNSDGSTTLPAGGTITNPGSNNGKGGSTINVPPGTIVTEDGKISFPSGSGGGTITYDNGHTFNISEDATIIMDDDIPLGYYIAFENPFEDVDKNAWYFDCVMFAYAHGLMVGTNADPITFSPNMTTTRGMIVTVLYRMAGSPDVSGLSNPFSDIAGEKWYSDAVIWAAANGIVSGYGGGLYGSEDNVTREQLAVILNNYINYMGLMLPEIRDYTGFNDDIDCANYAKEAIERFFKSEIVSGKPGNIFDPKGDATRAEVATMLKNFLEAVTQK